MNIVSKAVVNGEAIIILDKKCEIDSALANLIDKNVFTKPNNTSQYILFNNCELVFNPNFKLFIINNSAKVKLSQDIATRLNIVNFALKPDTLEKKLLNIV